MKRAMIFLLTTLALYLGWRFGAPYFDTHPEQDACEFGPVSNARYRELLAEARKRSETVWPQLKGAQLKPADNLRHDTIWPPSNGAQLEQGDNLRIRIADLTAGTTSLEERIAGMHAVMRETGAFFLFAKR